MNMNPGEKAELIKELEKIAQYLIKTGLLPEVNPKELAKEVAGKLESDPELNLSLDDVKNNPETKKSLGLSLMAQANPQNKFDFTMLFKPMSDLDPEKLKHSLKSIFTNAMKLSPAFAKKTKEEKEELEEKLDTLVNKIVDQLKRKHDVLGENRPAFDMVAALIDLASEQRRRLYGGIDPTMSGTFTSYTSTQPIGDQIGAINFAHANDNTFQGERKSTNPGVADPTGIIFSNILKDLTDGVCDDLQEALIAEGMLNFAPKPSGPGGVPIH